MSVKIRCRDLLALEHPECITDDAIGGCKRCPRSYGYIVDKRASVFCWSDNCTKCWDQLIEIDDERAEKLGIINKKDEVKSMELKDSGERREFGTGAVRDIQEGKGRCDLMPLDVLAGYYSIADYIVEHPNNIFDCLDQFKRTGHVTTLYLALWMFINEHCPCPETAFLDLSKHFEDGAKKYGDNNWQKGIPVRAYMDSAVRHYLKWIRGDDDEPHERAFMWNIVCCIWTMIHKPELDDFTEKGNKENGEQSETKWADERASKKTDCECSEERATR